MISTTSAIHHILTLGGVNSLIIFGGSDTKSTLNRRSATTTNDTIAMEEDDIQQQQPTCYICYETNDTNNIPTQRYCACRGTSGYVHTSCLLNYTQQQMIIQQQYNNNNHHSMRKLKPSTLLYCSICKNRYDKPLYSKLRNVILDSISKKSKSDKRHGRLISLHTLISVGLTVLYIFDILSILDVITFDESNIVPLFNNLPSIMPTLHIHHNLLLLSIDILIFLILTSQVSINTKSYTYCYITFLISRSLFSYKIGLYHGIETAGAGEGGEMEKLLSRMVCNVFKLVYDSNVWSVDERLLLGCADQL